MASLIIDQGNTRTKAAIFINGQIEKISEYDYITFKILITLKKEYDVDKCILSTVRKVDKEEFEEYKSLFDKFIFLDSTVKLPVKVSYSTPETLGADRLAAVVGASEQISCEPVIVIDAGTAITYDFLDEKGVFQGGNIAPGVNLRFKSLKDYTGALPLVEKEGETTDIGKSTKTAIRNGVVNGVIYEIEGFINTIKATHPSVLVFLTGGDSNYLSEKLKCPIFVDNNLVLKGLNRILNYNVEK